jgi:hypothetical protein
MLRSSLIGSFAMLIGAQCYAIGGTTSNGGDPVAAEFVRVGRHVADIISTFPEFGIPSIRFKNAIETTQISSSSQKLFLNGLEVTAINYPSKNITIAIRLGHP